MSQASAEGSPDDVGSVADEAAKLIGSLADWTRKHAAGEGPVGCGCAEADDSTGPAGAPAGDPQTDAAGSCAWCPVCRAHSWLRHLNPETKAHLGAAGASLAAAMTSLLAAPDAGAGADHVERVVVGDDVWPGDDGGESV